MWCVSLQHSLINNFVGKLYRNLFLCKNIWFALYWQLPGYQIFLVHPQNFRPRPKLDTFSQLLQHKHWLFLFRLFQKHIMRNNNWLKLGWAERTFRIESLLASNKSWQYSSSFNFNLWFSCQLIICGRLQINKMNFKYSTSFVLDSVAHLPIWGERGEQRSPPPYPSVPWWAHVCVEETHGQLKFWEKYLKYWEESWCFKIDMTVKFDQCSEIVISLLFQVVFN